MSTNYYDAENNKLIKISGKGDFPADYGTKEEFESKKDSLPDGTVFTTTDEFVQGGEKEIYSTDEVKTNKVWIDGKPIYRRVITGLSFGGALRTWTNVGATATLPNAETLVTTTVCRTYDNSIHTEIPIACVNGQLKYFIYDGMQASGVYVFDKIICEYTKVD